MIRFEWLDGVLNQHVAQLQQLQDGSNNVFVSKVISLIFYILEGF
jgi:hypothetical protein